MVKVPGCNAIVDGFQYTSNLVCPNYIFFLTHMHTDHYKGLTPTWNRGPIYCSPETAILLKDLYPEIPRIIPLELNFCHWIVLNSQTNEGINVTLMDANHCAGSVMLLFQGEKTGIILFTGDFRFIPSMLKYPSLLDSSGNLIKINHLFLDNTFSSPDFTFPPQEVCYQMLRDAIEENHDSDIWIKIECFGREEILIDLANYFKTLIVVNCKMYRRICLLGLSPEKFSTSEEDGYIKVVSGEKMKELYDRNKNQLKTVGVWLTGWCKNYSKSTDNGVVCYRIPFSLHSNSLELKEFVKAINATRITFTSSCAAKSKGNHEIMEETYKRSISPPAHQISSTPIKRKIVNPQSTILKKVKRPKVFGSKIK